MTPDNPIAETQFGMALVDLNRENEAMAHFERAIDLGSRDPTSYLNVGAYLSEHGDQRQAIAVLETAASMGGTQKAGCLPPWIWASLTPPSETMKKPALPSIKPGNLIPIE